MTLDKSKIDAKTRDQNEVSFTDLNSGDNTQ